jgi:hypothetical protein
MESATRGAYARRGNIKVDTTDETHRLSALLEAAIDAWNADTRKARAKRPEPRHWHKQHQAPVRKSLAELLAEADKREREPLDCSGWENQIYDGDSPLPKLALL